MNLPLLVDRKELILRNYQNTLVSNVIQDVVHAGHKQVLVISPTGSGKTVCFIRICEELIANSNDDEVVLVLSHLSLLTDQTKAKFNKFSPLDVGILRASLMPDANDRVIISTMQSSREFSKIVSYYEMSGKKVKYIIIDEAHMRYSGSYNEIFDTFPQAQIIDFTATPFKNKRLATGAYDSISFQISLMELIEQKYLVPPILKQVLLENDTPEKRCAITLKTYLEFEAGKKAIMFMRNKDECKLLCDALIQEGVKAAVVTDSVTGKKRDKIFEGYDGDDYDLLVSVNVLTAGFDSLLCECVFMFGTDSPTVYLQRVGRALRPIDGDSVKPHHSKQDARVYVFGDTPTIESGIIEKHHNMAVKPKKFDECKTLDEQIDWLEDNDLKDTDEYKFSKAAAKVQKIAQKINMDTLNRMIESKSISSEFMLKLADTVDNFKPIQGGDVPASIAQRNKLNIKANIPLTSNEASLLIQAMTGDKVNHHSSQKFVVQEGKFKGSHVKDLSWAYKSVILKKFPQSPLAKMIREFHPKAR
jgi:superfamily II DNA or RNA helicase